MRRGIEPLGLDQRAQHVRVDASRKRHDRGLAPAGGASLVVELALDLADQVRQPTEIGGDRADVAGDAFSAGL